MDLNCMHVMMTSWFVYSFHLCRGSSILILLKELGRLHRVPQGSSRGWTSLYAWTWITLSESGKYKFCSSVGAKQMKLIQLVNNLADCHLRFFFYRSGWLFLIMVWCLSLFQPKYKVSKDIRKDVYHSYMKCKIWELLTFKILKFKYMDRNWLFLKNTFPNLTCCLYTSLLQNMWMCC